MQKHERAVLEAVRGALPPGLRAEYEESGRSPRVLVSSPNGLFRRPIAVSRHSGEEQKAADGARREARRIVREFEGLGSGAGAPRVRVLEDQDLRPDLSRDEAGERTLIDRWRTKIHREWVKARRPENMVVAVAPDGGLEFTPGSMPPPGHAVALVQRAGRHQPLIIRISNFQILGGHALEPVGQYAEFQTEADEEAGEFTRVALEEIPPSVSADPEASSPPEPGAAAAGPPAEETPPMTGVTPEIAAARETRSYLTLSQQLAVKATLEALLTRVNPELNLWEYAEGHSDRTVAQGCAFRCTEANVRHVRNELFGGLRPPPTPSTADERLEAAHAQLAVLRRAFIKLCEAVGEKPGDFLPTEML